jgi:hypothetical protein
MKLYTVKVHNEHGTQNFWSGNDMSKAMYYETVVKQHYGEHGEVWICNNMQELTVGYNEDDAEN